MVRLPLLEADAAIVVIPDGVCKARFMDGASSVLASSPLARKGILVEGLKVGNAMVLITASPEDPFKRPLSTIEVDVVAPTSKAAAPKQTVVATNIRAPGRGPAAPKPERAAPKPQKADAPPASAASNSAAKHPLPPEPKSRAEVGSVEVAVPGGQSKRVLSIRRKTEITFAKHKVVKKRDLEPVDSAKTPPEMWQNRHLAMSPKDRLCAKGGGSSQGTGLEKRRTRRGDGARAVAPQKAKLPRPARRMWRHPRPANKCLTKMPDRQRGVKVFARPRSRLNLPPRKSRPQGAWGTCARRKLERGGTRSRQLPAAARPTQAS